MLSEQILAKSSFFNTIEDNFNGNQRTFTNLWLTQDEFEQQYSQVFEAIPKGNLLYSGIICKQDGEEDVNEYFFKLYDKFLVQYSMNKAKQEIIAIMPLLFVRMEYQFEFNSEDELPFIFLTKNKQSDILVPETVKQFRNWIYHLRSRCVMSYYSDYYQNKKIIGKGSFAKVMLCESIDDKKQFAVKIYDKKKIQNSKNSLLTRLGIQNELKILQSLNHKNIISLHEIYEGQFHIYMVFDLLTGGELFDKLQTKETYCERDAYLLMRNLFGAINHLHEQGIMHRDIKPENLILRNNESDTDIVLVDFGLSEKFVGNEQQLIFKRCGTPGYVAPEVLNNKDYDMQADVFSLGIIFYIILTGYAPFFGDTYDEILQKNKKCKICFDFHRIGISLSPEGIDLLKQMLNPNPSERITIKQAFNHPWMQSFLTKEQQSNETLSKLKFSADTATLKNIIKSTKPQQQQYIEGQQQQLTMISPIINGNIQEIKSPYNSDSPQVLQYTPVDQRKKSNLINKEEKKRNEKRQRNQQSKKIQNK